LSASADSVRSVSGNGGSDVTVKEHARILARYLAGTLKEREYRASVKALEAAIGHAKYREIHSAAIRMIGEKYAEGTE
jgi:uncharacterized protein YqeY